MAGSKAPFPVRNSTKPSATKKHQIRSSQYFFFSRIFLKRNIKNPEVVLGISVLFFISLSFIIIYLVDHCLYDLTSMDSN